MKSGRQEQAGISSIALHCEFGPHSDEEQGFSGSLNTGCSSTIQLKSGLPVKPSGQLHMGL